MMQAPDEAPVGSLPEPPPWLMASTRNPNFLASGKRSAAGRCQDNTWQERQ